MDVTCLLAVRSLSNIHHVDLRKVASIKKVAAVASVKNVPTIRPPSANFDCHEDENQTPICVHYKAILQAPRQLTITLACWTLSAGQGRN